MGHLEILHSTTRVRYYMHSIKMKCSARADVNEVKHCGLRVFNRASWDFNRGISGFKDTGSACMVREVACSGDLLKCLFLSCQLMCRVRMSPRNSHGHQQIQLLPPFRHRNKSVFQWKGNKRCSWSGRGATLMKKKVIALNNKNNI